MIIIIEVEAAHLRGAQMISWTQQKHSLVHVPSSPYLVSHWPRPTTCQPACLRASPTRWRETPAGGQGEDRRGPAEAPQIS